MACCSHFSKSGDFSILSLEAECQKADGTGI